VKYHSINITGRTHYFEGTFGEEVPLVVFNDWRWMTVSVRSVRLNRHTKSFNVNSDSHGSLQGKAPSLRSKAHRIILPDVYIKTEAAEGILSVDRCVVPLSPSNSSHTSRGLRSQILPLVSQRQEYTTRPIRHVTQNGFWGVKWTFHFSKVTLLECYFWMFSEHSETSNI